MHYTGQDMLWLIGSLSRIFRIPFDPQLIRQQFPPPYSRTALLNALQALEFKVGEWNLDDEESSGTGTHPVPGGRLPARKRSSRNESARTQTSSRTEAGRSGALSPKNSPNKSIPCC